MINIESYIDGLMLSDGHTRITSPISGRYTQKCKYREWLEVISNDLYEFGINSKINEGKIVINEFTNGTIQYYLWSKCYPYFKKMSERWYKNVYYEDKEGFEFFKYKKIVPKDIKLTPECVANWYLGDGSIYKTKNANSFLVELSTHCFSKNEVEYLLDKILYYIDIKAYTDYGNRIRISNKRSVSEFLNYIKEYEVSCYSYKYPKGAI